MGRPLRILMINYEFPPWGGGSGNATRCLVDELAGRGDLRIDVLTSGPRGPGPNGTGVAPTVRVHRIGVSKGDPHYWTSREIAGWVARALPRARSLVRETEPDLCHCWGGWPAGWIGRTLRARVPYAVGLRGSDVPGYNPRLRLLDPIVFRPLARAVWQDAVAVTTVSDDLGRLARRTDPNLSYEVIRNGVDSQRFFPAPREDGFTFLFVGRLIERKGVGFLLDAFARVAARESASRLEIAGGGPLRRALAARAAGLGIAGRVSFLGPVDPADVPALYRRAAAFVMPSMHEAMSNAALEAMASGLPVITTRTGVAEVVTAAGHVVEWGRTDQLAYAMRRYLRDPALREAHGRKARRIAESMSWGRVAEAYRATYDRVMGALPAR